MLCQNCGKNEANVRYTQIINSTKKEMILCEDCAQKLGINNFKMNMPIHFSNFLDDIFDDEKLLPNFMKEKSNTCNNCEELYDDFIKTGLLGCPECYDIFDDRIEPILKHIQGNSKHVGRAPLNIAEKLQNTGENKMKKSSEKSKNTMQTADSKKENKSNQENKMIQLEQLKRDLNKAIKDERYEDAAIIRDKIKSITDNK